MKQFIIIALFIFIPSVSFALSESECEENSDCMACKELKKCVKCSLRCFNYYGDAYDDDENPYYKESRDCYEFCWDTGGKERWNPKTELPDEDKMRALER